MLAIVLDSKPLKEAKSSFTCKCIAPIEAKSTPEINIDVKLLILNNGMD